jgi:hypothetical protein
MIPERSRAWAALILGGLHAGWAPAADAVPPPARTPARVVVSARTSTVQDVKTVAVGNQVPATFSGDRVKNTPGFSWYVSQHYALKTDYPEATARSYLTLLELAYPHYLELFGREPPGIKDKRMAVVYASSAAQLTKALTSDGIAWNFQGGGITYEGFNCAYQYPSGSLQYHQRYILLHECTHLFQICLTGNFSATPAWYFEGVADSLGHHVYDEKKRQLTVHVLDKAAIANYLDEGLARHRTEPLSFEKVHRGKAGGREVFFLVVHFLMDDPGRLQQFRIWRDEMFAANLHGKHQELSGRLLQDLFGPWERLDADFRRWVGGRHNTFHYVDWGWEQDGNTLWSYGFATGGKLSQTDVLLPPGEKPVFDPLRMDYPAGEVSPLVGKVERGVAEPAAGCLIDFSRNPRHGRAGIGLGVVGGPGITPFGADQLFLDREGKKKGVTVSLFELGAVTGKGLRPEDVRNGDRVATSEDAQVALGVKGSAGGLLRKNFVVEWDGWLRIAKPGEHTLGIQSDHGCWLWLDDRLVVDRAGRPGQRFATGGVKLDEGMHRLRLRYFQKEGPRTLAVGFAPAELPGSLRLLIEGGTQLVLDGTDLGLERKVVPLPDDFLKAMAEGKHRLGLNARIAARALEVTLRAQGESADRPVTFQAVLPLTAESRARLLARPLTLLARDGYHGLTPFFDDLRRPEPDLSQPAPANRWRNPGDRQLALVYRASWRLGSNVPPSLERLRESLRAAADQGPQAQKEALDGFNQRVAAVRADVRKCEGDPEVIAKTLADLDAAESGTEKR